MKVVVWATSPMGQVMLRAVGRRAVAAWAAAEMGLLGSHSSKTATARKASL